MSERIKATVCGIIVAGVLYMTFLIGTKALHNIAYTPEPDTPEDRLIEVLTELEISLVMLHTACVKHHGEAECFADEDTAEHILNLRVKHGLEINRRIAEICGDDVSCYP